MNYITGYHIFINTNHRHNTFCTCLYKLNSLIYTSNSIHIFKTNFISFKKKSNQTISFLKKIMLYQHSSFMFVTHVMK